MPNYLSKAVASNIISALEQGRSIREVERRFKVCRKTVLRYKKFASLPAKCGCGAAHGHRGWCRERYARSVKRQTALHPKNWNATLELLASMHHERTCELEPFGAFDGDMNRFKIWLRGTLAVNSRTKEFKWSVTDRDGKAQIKKRGAWSEFWREPTRLQNSHRAVEVFRAMPVEVIRDVMCRNADTIFFWLPYGEKLALIEDSGWLDSFIEQDTQETMKREDRKWLRQAKRTLGQIKAILRKD